MFVSKTRSNVRGSAPWRAGWSCWTVVVAIVWAACVGVCVAAPKGTGGIGGGAATRQTGSFNIIYGTTITITVGAGGIGPTAPDGQSRDGGSGASGYVAITASGTTTTYTAGTHTRTIT